jgi:hypothetical protein
VYTKGSPLEGAIKPNLAGAFPRGAAKGVVDVASNGKWHEGKETISLRHHHMIAGRSLVSDHLWVPFCQQDGSFMWVEGNPGTYRRGSVPNLNKAIGGADLALGHYSAGTAVQGDIPLPEQETSDDGEKNVNILPTYQEVLFLIRVK